MAKVNILTAEQELKLRRPIEDYVGKIQAKLDSLREDGTTKVVELQNDIDSVKRDHIYTKQEKETELTRLRAELENGAVKAEVTKLSGDVETAVVYAAAYASNGALISVSAQEVEPEAGGSVSVTLELDTEGASEIKAFLWTDGMVALDRAVKVK